MRIIYFLNLLVNFLTIRFVFQCCQYPICRNGWWIDLNDSIDLLLVCKFTLEIKMPFIGRSFIDGSQRDTSASAGETSTQSQPFFSKPPITKDIRHPKIIYLFSFSYLWRI